MVGRAVTWEVCRWCEKKGREARQWESGDKTNSAEEGISAPYSTPTPTLLSGLLHSFTESFESV